MQAFSRNSLTFSVIDKGAKNNETVILLHGFPSTTESLVPIANKLIQNGFRVLIPELRGYSSDARPKHRRDYRLAELVDDIKSLMDAASVRQAHVVGHDWGGAVAWAFASTYPKRASSLTAISAPHPQAFANSLWQSRQLFMSWYMIFFQLPRLPEKLIVHDRGSILLNMLLRSGLNRHSALGYVKQMQDKGRATCSINWYRALPYNLFSKRRVGPTIQPTLFVYGKKDSFLSRRAAKLTRQWAKGFYEERLLSDKGHWLPEECPDVLAKYIMGFIQRNTVRH